jgi:hypothetical protein
MNIMKLTQKYDLNINGMRVDNVTIKSEWNGLIELDGGSARGKIIVRRRGWNQANAWAKEANAFIDQEIDIISSDRRFGLPVTEVIFVKPDDKVINGEE